MPKPAALVLVHPWIDGVHFVQHIAEFTGTDFTEFTLQTNEGIAIGKTLRTTGNGRFLFNLPDSIQVATQGVRGL